MKKILMGLFLLLTLVSIRKVDAQNYNLRLLKQQGIYFHRDGDVFIEQDSPYYIYNLGDIYAYCVDPGFDITTFSYVGNDNLTGLNYSDEIKNKIKLIGYYGRDYPNHDSVRYSMATQALIWELLGTGKVTFWTGSNKTGSLIDVSNERNEILNLVNNHMNVLNVTKDVYGYYNDKIVIEDDGLEDYYISDYNGNNNSYIEGNKLYISSMVIGDSYITLTKKAYDNRDTILFVGNGVSNTQKLALLRLDEFPSFKINIHLKGIKLKIMKKDDNKKDLKISGIKFRIKNLESNEYLCENTECIFETNDNGIVLTDGVNFGKYEIEEVENQIVSGYIWNSDKMLLEVKKEGPIYYNEEIGHYNYVIFKNKSVKATINIHKMGEIVNFNNNLNYLKEDLSNIEFEIYDENNNYIDKVITDSNGMATYEYLKVGKYYLKEINMLDKYVNEIFPFEVKQENQYDEYISVDLEVLNKIKKGSLEFIKKDLDTNEGIIDTIIEIYDVNNNLLFTKKTDSNGRIIINELPFGEYYLIEKEANYYYEKSDDKLFFEIKEDNELVKKEMTNRKIKGSLKLTKLGEKYEFKDNDVDYFFEKMSNIEFMLYNENNELLGKLVTDENGYVEYNNLPPGKYFVKENYDNEEYNENLVRYYFEIEKDSNNHAIDYEMEITNYLKKGTLDFFKSDLLTNKGIQGTIIEIYDDEDNILFTRETDELGKIEIQNIPLGKYYIIEKQANKMYQITNEKIYFEIKENGEIVNANMVNERKEVLVPKTGKNNNYSSVCLLFSFLLGGIYYGRKRTY